MCVKQRVWLSEGVWIKLSVSPPFDREPLQLFQPFLSSSSSESFLKKWAVLWMLSLRSEALINDPGFASVKENRMLKLSSLCVYSGLTFNHRSWTFNRPSLWRASVKTDRYRETTEDRFNVRNSVILIRGLNTVTKRVFERQHAVN